MTTIPPTMRAVTYSRPGPPTSVLTLTTIPTPPPPKGSQILIHISHAAIEPGEVDVLIRYLPFPPFLRSYPAIPSFEFAGNVVALGPDAAPHFQAAGIGARVLGAVNINTHIFRGIGTLAEYILVDGGETSKELALCPPNLPPEQATGLIGSGSTARELILRAGVKNGDTVLINGASGAVGTATVQLAKLHGAHVVAVCSGQNAALVRSLGADEVLDYTAGTPLHVTLASKFATKQLDAVLDAVGSQPLYTHSPAYLKPRGVYASVGAYAHGPLWTALYVLRNRCLPRALGGVPREFRFWSTRATREGVAELVGWAAEGRLRVVVDEVVALEDFRRAFERVESRRARGKVVVRVR